VAYALSDEMKIIDLGRPSRSVTTSTVGPTLATAGIFVSSSLQELQSNDYNFQLTYMIPVDCVYT